MTETGGVRVSNREIYDLVQRMDRRLEAYIATNDMRVSALEKLNDAEEMAKKTRLSGRRQWLLAIAGWAISVPLSIWAAVKGVS